MPWLKCVQDDHIRIDLANKFQSRRQAEIQNVPDQNVPDYVRQNRNASSQDIIRTFEYVIKPSPHYSVYELNINIVLLHFDLVAYCVEQNLCDQSFINSFYCDEYKYLRAVFVGTLSYYSSEGINVGTRARRYFDAKCM